MLILWQAINFARVEVYDFAGAYQVVHSRIDGVDDSNDADVKVLVKCKIEHSPLFRLLTGPHLSNMFLEATAFLSTWFPILRSSFATASSHIPSSFLGILEFHLRLGIRRGKSISIALL